MTAREIQSVFYDVLDKEVTDEVLSSKKELREWIQRMVWHVRKTNELEDELKKSYDFNAKEYVKGWNDGRNYAFDIILNLLERIEDKNRCCQNDRIKLFIDGCRMIENYPIKMVTNAKEAEEYPIMSEATSKRFEEFFKMMRGEQE